MISFILGCRHLSLKLSHHSIKSYPIIPFKERLSMVAYTKPFIINILCDLLHPRMQTSFFKAIPSFHSKKGCQWWPILSLLLLISYVISFILGCRHLSLKLSHHSIQRKAVNGGYIKSLIIYIRSDLSEAKISNLWIQRVKISSTFFSRLFKISK